MRFSKLAILALVLMSAASQAQTSCLAVVKCADRGFSEGNRDDAATDHDIAMTSAWSCRISAGLGLLEKMDNGIISQFKRAWQISHAGNNGWEAVVLIFRTQGGSYRGHSLGVTGEFRKFTFQWDPAAVAIVHTHPNNCDPKPSKQDQRLAERIDVPIFTLTLSGMYVYDPETKITRKVLNRLDWLRPSKWTQDVHRNLIAGLFGEYKARLLHSAMMTEAKHKPAVDTSGLK